jgi:hypothetical protein
MIKVILMDILSDKKAFELFLADFEQKLLARLWERHVANQTRGAK